MPDVIDDEKYQSTLRAEIDDAVNYNDEYIAPGRTAATLYYRGHPFGTEEAGRSKIVMPVVRDTVRATLPSLMKIFFGASRVVEFMASATTSGDLADDATETVNYVFTRLNPGWSICWSAFKDALVRKTGWIKWWYDQSIEVTSTVFSGVSEAQLIETQSYLKDGEDLQVLSRVPVENEQAEPEEGAPPQVDPVTGQPVPTAPVYEYEIQLTKRAPVNKIRVAAVPPDEVLLDRNARSETEARIVIHRTHPTRSDLIAMGVPAKILEEEGSFETFDGQQSTEISARLPGNAQVTGLNLADATEDQEVIPHYECYWRVDRDGDGISELRKVCAVGRNRAIYYDRPVDEVQLASFCPDPEPHVAVGLSQADSTMDLQLIESHVTRDILDALKASIFPRTVYVEGQVNPDDILNTEIGAAIRARQPGMVSTLEVPFPGREAYPLLEHLRQVREERTGVGRAAMGLDGSALQSTTPDAARQSMTASQAQVDLIARIFAETGMKRVFRGILRLLTRHQNTELQIHLNGRTLRVNPCEWDPDMEVSVNTGLGNSTANEKIAVLAGVAAQQKEVLQTLGADNPLCGLEQYYNTQAKILELSGFRDTSKFWIPPKLAAAMGKQLPTPQPTPEQILADAQVKIEQSKHELEALKAILLDDRERDKNEADMLLRAAEIQARYQQPVDIAALTATVDRDRNTEKMGHERTMQALQHAHEATLALREARARAAAPVAQ